VGEERHMRKYYRVIDGAPGRDKSHRKRRGQKKWGLKYLSGQETTGEGKIIKIQLLGIFWGVSIF